MAQPAWSRWGPQPRRCVLHHETTPGPVAYRNLPRTPVSSDQQRGAFCVHKGSALGVTAAGATMARKRRTLRAKTACRATTAPVEILPIPGKGFGAIARRDIARGELVLEERPTITYQAGSDWPISLQQQFDKLPAASQSAVMDLYDASPGEKTLKGIFDTNSIGCSSPTLDGVLCLSVSRINHSCWPNCEQFWDEQLFREKIFACKDIKKGEELCISYVEPYLLAEERDDIFRRRYAFECAGSAPNREASDRRRKRLGEALAELGRGVSPDADAGVALAEDMQRPRGDLVAVNALWMVGHVQSVLACEIRLQSLNLQDFMAPRHEVHPDIFALSGAWPGGPLGPLVAFRADDRPGAPEAEGLQRARSVQLASAVTPLACSIQRSLPDPPTCLTGLWDHGLKRCPIAEAAFLEWWSLMESHSQAKVMARNVQLQESFGHATAEADGSRVSSILLCCIAGLLVLSKVESCGPRLDQKSGDWLPSCVAELLSTANSCWGALDLQHASTRRTLLVAKPLCQHLAVQGTGDEWQKFADFVEQCFSRKAEMSGDALQSVVRKRCDVAGCTCVAARRVHRQDAYGPAGFRCDRHKTALQPGVMRQCDVAGCTSVAVRCVRKHDAYGTTFTGLLAFAVKSTADGPFAPCLDASGPRVVSCARRITWVRVGCDAKRIEPSAAPSPAAIGRPSATRRRTSWGLRVGDALNTVLFGPKFAASPGVQSGQSARSELPTHLGRLGIAVTSTEVVATCMGVLGFAGEPSPRRISTARQASDVFVMEGTFATSAVGSHADTGRQTNMARQDIGVICIPVRSPNQNRSRRQWINYKYSRINATA
ncbi:set5 [Symbiodinium sp. CCMP2592]|nr:set5 [Symbiodinium sp. CCMP2592]